MVCENAKRIANLEPFSDKLIPNMIPNAQAFDHIFQKICTFKGSR